MDMLEDTGHFLQQIGRHIDAATSRSTLLLGLALGLFVGALVPSFLGFVLFALAIVLLFQTLRA